MDSYSHNANSLMPLMTANDIPSPVIITDSTSSSTSYHACDRYYQDAGWFASGATGWWKVYTGGEGWVVTSYTITHNYQYGTYPSAWTFLGSNNDSDWTTLDTISGQSFASFEMKTYSIPNTQSYTYYKINVTGNNGGSWVGFSELELIGTIYVAPPPPPPSSKVPSGDIVPRANGFGSLGTTIKKWLNGYFYNIFATGGTISGVNMISASGETISGPVTTSAGVGDANKLVALNNLGIIDSTMISGTIGGSSYVGLTWNMATSSIPVLANNGYFLNPSGNITLTLPSSPSVGDPINIVDIYNKASTYVITVARNGNNIEGVAEDLIINIDGAGISLVYADVPRGWEIVSEIGRRGINSGTSDIESIVTSSGSVDAGKIPELGQDGLLDVSFFPEGIGGATVSGVSSSAGVVDAGKIPILDLDGLLDNSFFPEDIGGGISAGLSILASENLSPGNFINIYNDSGARCRKAIATSFETEAHGYVLTSASGSESIVVYFDGINDQLSGLIPGPLFLSTTPGLCSSTSASGSGNIVQRLGLAISETTMNFKPQAIILLE